MSQYAIRNLCMIWKKSRCAHTEMRWHLYSREAGIVCPFFGADNPGRVIRKFRGRRRKALQCGTIDIDIFAAESSICTKLSRKFVLSSFESKVERIAAGCYTVLEYGSCGRSVPTRQMREIARRCTRRRFCVTK